jgi:hypothetical protein
MSTPEDYSENLKAASYAAYNEAIRAAYRTLSDLITEYFSGNREIYDHETLEIPSNFRPLKDYERTLKIQQLTLRLALKTADRNNLQGADHAELAIHPNGYGPASAAPVLPVR